MERAPFELENPLARLSGSGGGGDAEAGNADATLQQQVAGLEARLKTLEMGGSADAAIRSVFASIGTAPANMHQATIFFLASEKEVDQAMRKRAPLMFAGGLLIILFQIIVCAGLFVGNLIPSCETNLQCANIPGTLCTQLRRCSHCGQTGIYPPNELIDCDWGPNEPHVGRAPLVPGKCYPNMYQNKTAVAEICADPQDRRAWSEAHGTRDFDDPIGFKADGVRNWCESCIFTDGEVNRFTIADQMEGNVRAMGAFDWLTLFFASYVAGLAIAGELRDIELCLLAIERIPREGALSWKWISSLSFCLELRRFVFLPAMLNIIATLVILKGGDSLSICFNTVAIIFLMEIDNISYHVGLGELQKARVESVGRVVLSDAEAKNLAWLKVMYVPVTVVSVLSSVATMDAFLGFVVTSLLGGLLAPAATIIVRHRQRDDRPPVRQLLVWLAMAVCKWGFSGVFYVGTVSFAKHVNV